MNEKFVSKISKMGDNQIIWIPASERERLAKYMGRSIIVTIEPAIPEVSE